LLLDPALVLALSLAELHLGQLGEHVLTQEIAVFELLELDHDIRLLVQYRP
jgi:hypothetical protein